MPADIRVRGVAKHFGDTTALEHINIELPGGAFSVLLGPSGCGKTTLLRMIAGLDQPSSGRILIGDDDITDRPPSQRNLAMVFQSYALFPHLNVAENILFGLSVRGTPKAEQRARLERIAGMMGLMPLLDRKPGALSGGQQQRVALARAAISERPVCLMDEPLSNLDAKLRAEMRVEIRELQQRLGLTMVYVTHDQVEAMTMADRIIVMNAGRVEQAAAPPELYGRPQTTFCARFVGMPPMNLIPTPLVGGLGNLPDGCLVGVRPEDMETDAHGLPAEVVGVEYLGADRLVFLQSGETRIVLRQPARTEPPAGSVRLSWSPDAMHLFDAAGHRMPADVPTTRALQTRSLA